jgi:hypothetical protein
VKKLLTTRADIFPTYTLEGFEAALAPRFKMLEKVHLRESERTLYFMEVL